MTKFILQSGGLKKHPDQAKKYFAELLDGLGKHPKLLWCFFATLPDDPEVRFKKYTAFHQQNFPKGVEPININAEVDIFEEQVRNADAIYMHGGEVAPLYEILSTYDLKKLFKDKRVGTNSASSMVLAQYTWPCTQRIPMEGLGLFPIKYIAHYDSDFGSDDPRGSISWQNAYEELKDYGDTSIPIHALREGEYIIFEE